MHGCDGGAGAWGCEALAEAGLHRRCDAAPVMVVCTEEHLCRAQGVVSVAAAHKPFELAGSADL
jgi:hypothetical protein